MSELNLTSGEVYELWQERNALRAENAQLRERAEAAEAALAEEKLNYAGALEDCRRYKDLLAEARERIAELESHFPRTKDGVPVTPGMVVYCPRGHQHNWLTSDFIKDCSLSGLLVTDCTAAPPAERGPGEVGNA